MQNEQKDAGAEAGGVSHYAAPQSDLGESSIELTSLEPASRWARFGNYVIDYIAVSFLILALTVAAGLIGGDETLYWIENMSSLQEFLLGWSAFTAYYIIFEGTFNRSLGKMATGTIVIHEDGGAPSMGQIVGRSFARLIPFEPLSLFQSSRLGWHDSMANTKVVKVRGNTV